MIYFDNGASSHPKPINVYKNTFEYIVGNGANAGRSGHRLAISAAQKIYEARKEIARFFAVDLPEKVIFTLNATYSINTVLHGVLMPGDHVITTNFEHNSVLRPLYALEQKGVALDVVDVDLYDDEVTLKNIKKRITSKTRAIVITQCSNVCGKMLPIEQIASFKRGKMLLIVDGSQGAGSVPLNFDDSDIDFYCAPSHKGLLGLQGSGIILCKNEMIISSFYGGTGGDSFLKHQPEHLPDKLEAGTLPIPAICSMLEGVRSINTIGIDSVFYHKKHLVKLLSNEMKEIHGVECPVDYDKIVSPGVFCFNIKDMHSEEVGHYLDENGIAVRSGIHCAPLFHQKMGTEENGMVRVSFGLMNTEDEIKYFLQIIKKIVFL